MKNFLISLILKMYMMTIRFKINVHEDVEKLLSEGKQLVFFCWHNQVLLVVGGAKRFRFTTMVSRSKDGDMLAPILERVGVRVVRASSSKGASAGLMEMVNLMERENRSAAMAVDGPKGPVYKAKPGIIYLAKKSDRLIVPVLGNAKRFKKVRSWDKMVIPKPFSSVTLNILPPLTVSESMEKSDVDSELLEIENKIMEMTRVYSKDII